MSQPGYVYILVNPSANEFLKIGKTERDPEARAKELSSATGVPTPFYVAFQSYFQDCTRAEEFVHARLAHYRVANNREFFRVPLRQAIDAILEAERTLQKTVSQNVEPSNTGDDASLDELSLASDEPWQACYDEAEAYYNGYGNTLQDYGEALRLYKQAAKLGCVKAFRQIGHMYREGEGCIADTQMALEYFKEGTRYGDGACWAEMAGIFFKEGHWDNFDKCWSRYFESEHFTREPVANNVGSTARGLYALKYVENLTSRENHDFPHQEQLSIVKDEMLRSCDYFIDYFLKQGWEFAFQDYRRLRKIIERF